MTHFGMSDGGLWIFVREHKLTGDCLKQIGKKLNLYQRSFLKRPLRTSFSRLRLVAAIIRTSTLMVRELPNRSNSPSWIILSNLGYGIGCGLFLPVLFADLFGVCFKKRFSVKVEAEGPILLCRREACRRQTRRSRPS
jgi:hypothetical protein